MEDGIEMKKESMEEFAVYLRERENAKVHIPQELRIRSRGTERCSASN